VTTLALPEQQHSPLREYITVLRKRKWSIALASIITVMSGALFSLSQTPVYVSEASVQVEPTPILNGQGTVAVPNMGTEQELASSIAVAGMAADSLDTSLTPEQLLKRVTLQAPPDIEILSFQCSDPQPLKAQAICHAFVSAYQSFKANQAVQDEITKLRVRRDSLLTKQAGADSHEKEAELQNRIDNLDAQARFLEKEANPLASQNVRLINPPSVPRSPASPKLALNTALSLLAGLAVVVGLAFFREHLDDSIRGRDDLEACISAPVLAVVPRVRRWRERQDPPLLVSVSMPDSPAAEAVRALRTGMMFGAVQRNAKTIMITSCYAGEGKSATTANLGVALARAGKRVILVSADLRRPRIHKFFGAPGGSGLTNVLAGETPSSEALLPVNEPNLRLLNSGPLAANPAELLGSDLTRRVLRDLAEISDFVLIDSAPILVVSDALTLAPLVDGVLIVADVRRSSRTSVEQARQQLDQVNARVVGAVLNNLDQSDVPSYSSYGGYQPSIGRQTGKRNVSAWRRSRPNLEERERKDVLS
jgi:succinoglycan biosynthesis transport protein ExoP